MWLLRTKAGLCSSKRVIETSSKLWDRCLGKSRTPILFPTPPANKMKLTDPGSTRKSCRAPAAIKKPFGQSLGLIFIGKQRTSCAPFTLMALHFSSLCCRWRDKSARGTLSEEISKNHCSDPQLMGAHLDCTIPLGRLATGLLFFDLTSVDGRDAA